jgi:hypothetical protein
MPKKPQWYEFDPNPNRIFRYLAIPFALILCFFIILHLSDATCKYFHDGKPDPLLVDLACTISVTKSGIFWGVAYLLAGVSG